MTHPSSDVDPSRRKVLLAGLGAAAAALLAACGRGGNAGGANAAAPPTTVPATTLPPTSLAATPSCADDDDVTPAQTEGPYFKPNSPERTNIRVDASGTKLLLTGTVVTTACAPVAKALVDFWQADASGNYDNSGFEFRGHQFTDAQGRYSLETVVPGLYPGRTRHIHVKVQAPGGKVLTTQLYFPGEPRNASDSIYTKDCEVTIAGAADGRKAAFRVVLAT